MKAILQKEFGGADQLYLGEHPTPYPSEDELLIKVNVAGVNRADILQRQGKYPPPKGASKIIGLEIAGKVVEKGSEVKEWGIGDHIYGIIPGGGYAEHAVIHKDMAMPVPKNISLEEAAAIPEAYLTAYQSLVWLAGIKPEDKVLIHAGASGVGTAAIQLVKHVGATCIITSSKAKHETCFRLGSDYGIDYHTEDFLEVISTNFGGVDIIIDFLGASYFERNIKSLNKDGRLVMLALMGGIKLEQLNVAPIVLNRLKITGSTLRSRSLDYQVKLTQEFKTKIAPHFDSEKLKPVVDSVFSWRDAKQAHEYMENNKNIGKIVLKID